MCVKAEGVADGLKCCALLVQRDLNDYEDIWLLGDWIIEMISMGM